MAKKQKTRKAVAKRFKITGTGKLTRNKQGKRHLLEHVSSKTKRNKQGDFTISPSDVKRIKRALAI